MNFMNRVIVACCILLCTSVWKISAQDYPFRRADLPVEERVEDLVRRMTLEEKIDLLAGYQDFYLHPCERLGIPAFKLADGPLGLASWGLFGKATAFPSALSLAASWNRDLAARVGDCYGQEWRARGIHFLLAPGVNTYRASKGARNFEYMGEDPYLSSEMVVPFIKGVQERGVIATVKHFAANDQEYDRYRVSSEVSERALREIYLPAFKAAVQKAGVKAVMTRRMTLEEKIDLLAGYQDFYLHPCERLGIPAFKLADGPLGLASWGLFGKATAFPSALSLAASWNRDLAARVGDCYGQEWRARGIHFLLAPGVNTYRASKGARNFEYMGEDPYLSSEMVVPFIKGVQERGVIATVKHFAANDQEYDRYRVSSEVSERALREIYLPAFKAAVQKAGVKAVMTGYNLLNGVYCTENKYLIDILKKEWGFKGMLMSDWACTYSADKAANHGLDLEMGSNDWFVREKLLPLIEQGVVTEETINEKVRRIYGTCIEMGFFDRPQLDTTIPVYNPKANRMAYEAAKEGMILLKNEDNLLPLKRVTKIAVIGPNACYNLVTDRQNNVNGITYGGGGSSKVHPWHVTSVLQGIEAEYPDAEVWYAEGISNAYKPRLFRSAKFYTEDGKQGLRAKYYKMGQGDGSALPDKLMQQQAKAAGRTEDSDNGVSAVSSSVSAKSSDKEPVMERIDRHVDFSWWGTPKEGLGEDYRVEWEGYVPVERNDSLLFFVDAQGGYRLWIDGKLCLDASASQSFDCRQVAVDGQKGARLHVKLEYLNQRSLPAEIRLGYDYKGNLDFSEALRLARQADVVIFCGGLDGSIELEGRDRPFELPYGQDILINQLAEVNPNLIVSLHAGGGVRMSPWIDRVKAVVHLLYPGQAGGRAFAEMLSGKVVPSAKLPFTIEKRWEDSPACGNYDETRKERKVYYNEGIFVGYRGYDRKQVEPLYPFGYGLSYTSFEYSDLQLTEIDKKNKSVALSFNITNTGGYEGAEVAQVYVRDIASKEARPLKELKGFQKVFLRPGETKHVSVTLDRDAFQYFSEKKSDWVFESGEFEIWVGASSKDIRLKTKVKM